MTALLEARHVTKAFGGGMLDRDRFVALEDFSISIDPAAPTITAIVGESGSGKTTLARMLLGLADPTEGEVLYEGRNLRTLPAAERRRFRTDVQAIFQDPYGVYNPFYRVDHVLKTPVAKFRLAKTRAEGKAMIDDALRAVGLRPEEILGRFPHQLSGGQRQRVMVARALLLKPRLIVADEPVSMVDASLRATILGSLQALHRERGISIIYITHDLATAFQVSDNIIVLYRAQVAEAGDVERVVSVPQHPYTQLLVGSIPQVSTHRNWGQEDAPAIANAPDSGCRFMARCPVATQACGGGRPGLFLTEPSRAVACFRHADAPPLPPEGMSKLLTASHLQG